MELTTIDKKDLSEIDEIGKEVTEVLTDLPVILSKLSTVMERPFKVIDKKAIDKIASRANEINEKITYFSRKDSQTTRKLMTLQMLHTPDSTYRVLRDVLANVERKEQVLSENIMKMKQQSVKSAKLSADIKSENDIYKKQQLELRAEKEALNLVNSLSYIEGAIKELGYLQDCYEQIKENKNISDDWDEYTFETEEIKAHIRTAFRLCIRDHMVNGRIGMGTVEYVEQFGISPMEAVFHVQEFIQKSNAKLTQYSELRHTHTDEANALDLLPDYDYLHDFLERMAYLYKDHYKKACKRLGIDDDCISRDFIVMTAKPLLDK